MIAATFHLELPNFASTLERAPGMRLSYVEAHVGQMGPPRFLFWAEGGDFEAFEEALESDPTVTAVVPLDSLDDRRLYRAAFTDAGMLAVAAYEAMMDRDGRVIEASGSVEGWSLRLQFPDRATLSSFHERCRELGLSPVLRAINATDVSEPGTRYGLTVPQQQVLLRAWEAGYFAVPKETSLVELAESLGVSDQAVSERLRRGLHALIANTLVAVGREPR